MTSAKTRTRQNREQSRQRIVEATSELVRERSFAALTVDEVMARAGIGRTLFYRHFDSLGDLVMRAAREAVDELFEAQVVLAEARVGVDARNIRPVIEAAVGVYSRHGPVLRAVTEAAADDDEIAAGLDRMRARFDELVVEGLQRVAGTGVVVADPAETARTLNILNSAYLLDCFGREPRVSQEVAAQTLFEIWAAVFGG